MANVLDHNGLSITDSTSAAITDDVPTGYAYWRLLVNTTSGSGSFTGFAEIEMRATPGGADQCSGGTATSSSDFDVSLNAPKAFDNDAATRWVSAGAAGSWIRYQFSGPVTVSEVAVTQSTAELNNGVPQAFSVQYSSDGSSWTTAWSVTGATGWSLGETRAYTDPGYVAGGALTGTSSLTFAPAGTVTGRGALSGTSSLNFAPSGTATGRGALTGASTLAFASTGAITGRGVLAGSSSLAFAPTGTIAGLGALTGSAAVLFAPSGTITGRAPITGEASLSFAPSGVLVGNGALVGASTLTFVPTGALSGGGAAGGALTGAASLSFAAAGNVVGLAGLSGSASFALSVSGTLTPPIVNPPARRFVIRTGDQGSRDRPQRSSSGGSTRHGRSGSSSRSYSSSRGR